MRLGSTEHKLLEWRYISSLGYTKRRDNKMALKPGYRSSPPDRIETATGEPVQLAFANDAEFQLGEKAEFKAHQLESGSASDKPYEGFVEVFEGALFRKGF